jgi:hypothetical protein
MKAAEKPKEYYFVGGGIIAGSMRFFGGFN